MNCISVAKGHGCIFKDRESCVGCSQEIYLKSTIFLIGQKLRELAKKIDDSKNQNTTFKYKQLINQIYKPALKEILIAMKTIYGLSKGDIGEYTELAFRISKSIGVEEDADGKKEIG